MTDLWSVYVAACTLNCFVELMEPTPDLKGILT